MSKNDVVELDKDIPAHLEQLDVRMKHIEQIAKTVEMVATNGFSVAEKYFQSKANQEQRGLELEDKQHKRMIIVLSGVLSMVFVLIMTAMLLSQFELVKIILGSTLAVGGGAGLNSLFKRKERT